MSFTRAQLCYMNPYDIHKAIINEYVLRKPGDTKLFKRDTSQDKTDLDIIKENHRFLWDDNKPDTWEQQFAKKYYDKLFKEYCIGDLSKYKENKIALRWRTEQEVIIGNGQFTCGNKKCSEKLELRTWEVNFGYIENGAKKNALVKIRLCPECSRKLNYYSRKREIKRLKNKSKTSLSHQKISMNEQSSSSNVDQVPPDIKNNEKIVALGTSKEKTEESLWSNLKPPEVKTRDEEMEEYLQDLLL